MTSNPTTETKPLVADSSFAKESLSHQRYSYDGSSNKNNESVNPSKEKLRRIAKKVIVANSAIKKLRPMNFEKKKKKTLLQSYLSSPSLIPIQVSLIAFLAALLYRRITESNAVVTPLEECGVSTCSTKIHPLWLPFVVLFFVLREIWRLVPDWAKLSHEGAPGFRDVFQKIRSVSNGVEKHVKLPDYWYGALVSYRGLTDRVHKTVPQYRDDLYHGSGEPLQSLPKMALDYFVFASWAYENMNDKHGPTPTLPLALQKRGFFMIRHDKIVAPGCVAYYVCASPTQKLAVISIKGTTDTADVLTDICSTSVDYVLPHAPLQEGGKTTIQVHEGIMYAADSMATELRVMIRDLFFPNDVKVVVTGHSLGAGVATLLCIYLRSCFPETRGTDRLQAVTYAPPAVVDRETALQSKDFITCVVNNADIVPRFSVMNISIMSQILGSIMDQLHEKVGRSIISKLYAVLIKSVDPVSCLNPTELRAAAYKALEEAKGLEESDHLYVSGTIYLLYDAWSKDGKETPADHILKCDGTANALHIMEFHDRIVPDHLIPAYRASFDAMRPTWKHQAALSTVMDDKNA